MDDTFHGQVNLNKTSPNTYSIGWHSDWGVGPTLHGGHVAAAMHSAAAAYLETELADANQPDILRMHFEFMRSCELCDSEIAVSVLKAGASMSTLQLRLLQNGKLKVLAIITSVNFDKPVGPSADLKLVLRPPPPPMPDFERAEQNLPQPDWLAATVKGEVLPCMERLVCLGPRRGFPTDGVIELWNHWRNVSMDAIYITIMADCFPSMADTLLGNKGIHDARNTHRETLAWDRENPGSPYIVAVDISRAMETGTFDLTLTLDVEFKRRVPKEGLRWIYTRLESKSLRDGRMDLDISICDQNMDLVAVASQVILVVDVFRKFGKGKL